MMIIIILYLVKAFWISESDFHSSAVSTHSRVILSHSTLQIDGDFTVKED